jgi:hypothetical protein
MARGCVVTVASGSVGLRPTLSSESLALEPFSVPLRVACERTWIVSLTAVPSTGDTITDVSESRSTATPMV